MITRHSSRRESLSSFLPDMLAGAVAYDRIAGYFSSSMLEIAGEAIESMAWDGKNPCVRVICNSQLDPLDIQTARAAKNEMWKEWCASLPFAISLPMKARLQRLHDFLAGGRLQIRVLPDNYFGLVHGKAGVVTRPAGEQICFIGSANESRAAWKMNYELVWLDDSIEGVTWVQQEFDALWTSPYAVELADAVIDDTERLSRHSVIPDIPTWKETGQCDPAAPIVELPIYRKENGLWAHQKYFIKLAFEEHQRHGARYVLADQVGLGKTVQLGLAAKLIALYGDKPILVLVPKPLQLQWQGELWNLLEFPSAIWNGRQWIDEQGIAHAELGLDGLHRCPRRVGIVSTGLINSGTEAAGELLKLHYDCLLYTSPSPRD